MQYCPAGQQPQPAEVAPHSEAMRRTRRRAGVVIAAKAESRNREIRKALLKTSNEEKQRIIQS